MKFLPFFVLHLTFERRLTALCPHSRCAETTTAVAVPIAAPITVPTTAPATAATAAPAIKKKKRLSIKLAKADGSPSAAAAAAPTATGDAPAATAPAAGAVPKPRKREVKFTKDTKEPKEPKEGKESKAKGGKGDSSEGSGKGGKEKDGPELPRAKSSYAFFQGARYEAIKKEQPLLPFGEVSKLISAEWKAISAEDRQQYQVRRWNLLAVSACFHIPFRVAKVLE